MYELYAQLLSKPTSEQSLDHCWRSYHLVSARTHTTYTHTHMHACTHTHTYTHMHAHTQHSGDYVSLMESPHLISNGTTGLTTWQVHTPTQAGAHTHTHTYNICRLPLGLWSGSLFLESQKCFVQSKPAGSKTQSVVARYTVL